METTFLVILPLFLFFQTYGVSSNNKIITTSSNVTCIQRERQSLHVFKQGLKDESNRLSTWTGVECCEWQGVGCDRRNGHVVKLDLRSPLSLINDHTLNASNWLEGKVSPSLLNLKRLRYLDLSMNNFSGQNIPEFFGSFMYLEYLNLSCSGFSGVVPPHLGNLSRLQYLDLNLNFLNNYRMVPQPYSLMVIDDLRWVSLLSSLKHLDFSRITISNHIDWFHPVNMLPSLLTLNLAGCHINISSIKFINFTSLNSLDLSGNNMYSTIPVWLSNLTGLVHLSLQDNHFHGLIPDFIGTLSSLSSIDLSFNFEVSGPIPSSIGNLSSLRMLSLHLNHLSGIPETIGQLSMLESLDISYNVLNGSIPESIGKLSMLELLDFGNNQLRGSIPEGIGQLSLLQNLYLHYNQLSGSIPESIGQLSMLENLYLHSNQLSGSIPESIGLLTELQVLYLYSNQLNGSIPTSLGQLSNLNDLDVSRNSLDGVLSEIHFMKLNNLTGLYLSDTSLTLNVSPYWIPPFQLKYFYASSCNIGPQFPSLIRKSTDLQFLVLSNSSIKDGIPAWFVNISSHLVVLDLSENQIGGNLPRIWNNQMDWNLPGIWNPGSTPPRTTSPPTAPPAPSPPRHQSTNAPPASTLPRTTSPPTVLRPPPPPPPPSPRTSPRAPSTTSLLMVPRPPPPPPMSPPETPGPPRYHGYGFTTVSPGLIVVNLGKNRLTGSFPTHLCELHSIQVLDLSDNNFFGVLPISLGSLPYLQSLHLHNNKFEGNLPVALQNLTSLVTFDLGNNLLTGNIPSWIGKKFTMLEILNLQSNRFMGKIPLELCENNVLRHLNLANNNITGMIPRCFYKLTGMITSDNHTLGYKIAYGYEENVEAYIKGIAFKYTKTIPFLISLDLSSNKVVGEIPDVLMNLMALKSLNLSRNLLSGQIPSTIGNLKQMESLDLSANKLSGRIPPSLASLNFLSYLNLSFNNLSGPIPFGNQLQTLGDPSTIYEGNTELCLLSLSRSCKENNVSYAHASENERKNGSLSCSWFYSGMVSGFVVGFMGLIGSLHFIRVWRVTYFNMIENAYTFLMISIIVTLARLKRKIFE